MRSYIIDVPYTMIKGKMMPRNQSDLGISASITSVPKRIPYNGGNSAFNVVFEPTGRTKGAITKVSIPENLDDSILDDLQEYVSTALGTDIRIRGE